MQSRKTRLAACLTAAVMMVALSAPEAMAGGKNMKKNPCDVKLPNGTCVVR